MPHLLTNLQPRVKIDRYANVVFTRLCLWFPLRLHHMICPEQIWENLTFRAWYLFPHVLSASSMQKFAKIFRQDNFWRAKFIQLQRRNLFNYKVTHCKMNIKFLLDLQLIRYEQRMVRIGKNDLNNRRLIEYAIPYCNSTVALLLIRVLTILTVFFRYKYNPVFSTVKPECILAIIC